MLLRARSITVCNINIQRLKREDLIEERKGEKETREGSDEGAVCATAKQLGPNKRASDGLARDTITREYPGNLSWVVSITMQLNTLAETSTIPRIEKHIAERQIERVVEANRG